MERTWKPTTAGVLSIVSGAVEIILGLVVVFAGQALLRFAGVVGDEWVTELVISVIMVVGPIWILLGAVALAGGISALRRRFWGLALAGSICALGGVIVLGILAIIFVALGRNEFE
ncbi:MAG: hypothetical protein ACNA7X_06340 [Dehalococcoidia bacterium]